MCVGRPCRASGRHCHVIGLYVLELPEPLPHDPERSVAPLQPGGLADDLEKRGFFTDLFYLQVLRSLLRCESL